MLGWTHPHQQCPGARLCPLPAQPQGTLVSRPLKEAAGGKEGHVHISVVTVELHGRIGCQYVQDVSTWGCQCNKTLIEVDTPMFIMKHYPFFMSKNLVVPAKQKMFQSR